MTRAAASKASHLAEPISRDGPEPAYEKVRRLLATEITTGRIRAGSRLVPERILCEQLGVSRVTLRRALQNLVQQGLLTPSAGRGWYATPGQLSESPGALRSFTALATKQGVKPRARVLSRRVRRSTAGEAEQLSVDRGERVLALERLRLFDDAPVAIQRSVVPLSRLAADIAKVDFGTASLYAALEERGATPTHAAYAIEADAADHRVANLLDIAVGAPVLITSQTTYDQLGRPVECGRITYRADRYRFHATLAAGTG
ncbi:GntR family transcriptional regulator [Actinopolymorpha sp. B9G3]|uniref:GntR family transcriptional regulator n=1 Tax=Actinopolymorpha sp. B9G3 TaxID=3158970 RepID=UPI0032D8FA13